MRHRTFRVAVLCLWLGASPGPVGQPDFSRASATATPAANQILAEAPTAIKQRLLATYGKLPLRFEANLGQTDPSVKFLSRGQGYTLFLTPTEAVLSLHRPQQNLNGRTGTFRVEPKNLGQPGRTTNTLLRIRLVGANPDARVLGQKPLAGVSNYLIGNDPAKWVRNIPHYAQVKVETVYPGVDVVYYGNRQNLLEFDFVIAPGADPGRIALSVEDAEQLRIDDKTGDLVAASRRDEIRIRRPRIHQEIKGTTKKVDGDYFLTEENHIKFVLSEYDPRARLIIDPVLSYSTYLGGSGADVASKIAVDSAGSAYVIGSTSSIDFPSVRSSSDQWDVFVSKLAPSGSALVYTTYLGGSNNDFGQAIAVDSLGNAFITGATWSADFPTVTPLQPTLGGSQVNVVNAFVTKLNASGSGLVYSTYLAGC